VDAVRFGRGIRALRLRRGWRQADLAVSAHCSASAIGRIERGQAEVVTVRQLEAVAAALGSRLILRLDWNGEALDRLLDGAHAELVERLVTVLRLFGWVAEPEATFVIGSERGSIDVLGWHAASNTMLIVEAKSVVPDVQAMLASLDRKVRLAPVIGARYDWRPRAVAALLVVADSRTSRRRIERHQATFTARFPDRIVAIRRFLRDPSSAPRLSGLWFLSTSHGAAARHRRSGRRAGD
jgi:transcriptional regulator with XRE-family HTH domain